MLLLHNTATHTEAVVSNVDPLAPEHLAPPCLALHKNQTKTLPDSAGTITSLGKLHTNANNPASGETLGWTVVANIHSIIPEELSTATHVFVRHDAIRRPLQPLYDGPYPITKRTPKHFTVNINGRHNTISIDCLKPAHIDTSTNTKEHSTEQSIPTSHPPTTPTHSPTTPRSTCSGCCVQIPFLLISFCVRHCGVGELCSEHCNSFFVIILFCDLC